MALRIVLGGIGGVLVVWTLSSAVRTVILPRVTRSNLDRLVFRSLRTIFRGFASLRSTYAWRDRVMALFAPLGLLSLVAIWLTLLTTGFMAIFWAVEQDGWAAAFHTSGSSLLTLGFAPVDGVGMQLVAFVEAALGLGLLALLITYLPAMYSAFSRRETLVGLLEVRAGTPPSAVEMLKRFHRLGWTHRLPDQWSRWEEWFAQVEESHTSYPALAFYRSPQPERHWVPAAGTVLDAAALALSSLEVPWQPQAALMIRAGSLSMSRIAEFFGVEHTPEPDPGTPIAIARSEWEEALADLEEAGVPLKQDRERAWQDFAGWRAGYDTVLLAVAEITTAPYAPWTSDRSALGYREVKVRRWGRRARADVSV